MSEVLKYACNVSVYASFFKKKKAKQTKKITCIFFLRFEKRSKLNFSVKSIYNITVTVSEILVYISESSYMEVIQKLRSSWIYPVLTDTGFLVQTIHKYKYNLDWTW